MYGCKTWMISKQTKNKLRDVVLKKSIITTMDGKSIEIK